MQRRQHRIADQLGVERHVEDERAVLDTRAEAQPRAIGNRGEESVYVSHAFASTGESMKVPVAIATGSSGVVWNATARAKATSWATFRHCDSTRMSV